MDFAVPADHRIELKESEKWAKSEDFARKLPPQNPAQLWNMNETTIPVGIGIIVKHIDPRPSRQSTDAPV